MKDNEKLKCMICGKEYVYLSAHLYRAHGMRAAEYRAKFPNAKIRFSEGKICVNTKKEFRKSIRERDKYSCQWCGVKEEVSLRVLSRRLIIHHIDEDRTNNDPENLVLLCIFCHRKVHTLMRIPTPPEITVENFPKAFAEIWPTEYK